MSILMVMGCRFVETATMSGFENQGADGGH